MTFGGAGTLLNSGRPCARRLELNEKDNEEAPNLEEDAKEEDASVAFLGQVSVQRCTVAL